MRKKNDQEQSERDGAADRPGQQDQAGGDAEHRGKERPPEAGGMARSKRGDQAGDATDQEKPAEENGDCDGRERRHDNGEHAKDDEHDALDQKQLPMLAKGLRHRLLQRIAVARIHRHVKPLPMFLMPDRNLNLNP